MRSLRWLLVVLAAVLSLVVINGTAAAATVYTDPVSGLEYTFSSTVGRFAGTASGDLPGFWNASVVHTPLSPDAAITGGEFALLTTVAGRSTTVRGGFAGGSVTRVDEGANCHNEVFQVSGPLARISGLDGARSGTFAATLTHLRKFLFGRCLTYGATIRGTLSLAA